MSISGRNWRRWPCPSQERQAAEQELQALLRKSGGDHQTDAAAAADIASAMAPDKEKAQKELRRRMRFR